MIIKVDWLSFTVPVQYPTDMRQANVWKYSSRAVARMGGEAWEKAFSDAEFEHGNGRAPFAGSLRCAERGTFIWYASNVPFVLVEFSGIGCDFLRASGVFESVLAAARDKVTRLDVACDMLTDTKPLTFSEARSNKRFKSGGHQFSDQGETVYVGSQKSNRFTRVYRYNPPHPRSNFLRCEMVVRDQEAKDTANAVLVHGVEQTAAALGSVFGWEHPDWKLNPPTELELKAFRPDRHGGKTEYWLHSQVMPAVEKLWKDGKKEQVQSFLDGILAIMKG